MNEIYVALPFAQFLIMAVLVSVVFLSAPRQPVNRLFAAFLVAMAAWGFAIFGMRDSFPDAGRAQAFENVVLAIIPFTGVLFYHFTLQFVGGSYPRRLATGFYGLAALAAVFSLLGWSAPGLTTKFYGFAPELGWAFPMVLAAAYPPVALAFLKLTKARRLAVDRGRRTQLTVLRWGVIASVLGGTSDFLPSLGLQIYPLGVLGNITFGLLATVAVTRYQLMDLRLVLRNGLVYGIVSSAAFAMYGITLFAVWLIARNLSDTALVMALGGTILITGLGAQPLVRKLQALVDRLFFRERADRLALLFSLSAKLRETGDLEGILERLRASVSIAIQPDWVMVLLPDREDVQFVVAASSNKTDRSAVALPRHGGIDHWFVTRKAALAGSMLDSDPLLQGLSDDERSAVTALDSSLLVPMIVKDTVTGLIAVGPKLVDDEYGRADVDFLMAVADHSAVAIENARLYAEEVTRRAEVERLDMMKSNLLRTVSHELKSPITAIKLSTELLESALDSADSNPYHVRMFGTLKSGTARLERLTQEALDYATMQSARLELQLESGSLQQVVNDVVPLIPAIVSRSQELTIEFDGELGRTMMDVSRVERIILNLLSNASKYTGEGGKIRISGSVEDEWHVVRVADTGRGIPKEDHELIFSPFYRSRVPDSSSVSGSGLGLSIARFLAEQHDGTLTVKSEPGQGSIFTLRLPPLGPKATDSESDSTPLPVRRSESPPSAKAPVQVGGRTKSKRPKKSDAARTPVLS